MNDEPSPAGAVAAARSGTKLVVVIAVVAVVGAAYFVSGMPGMGHGTGSSMSQMDVRSSASGHRRVAPTEFATALSDPGAVVINVHVPYEGEIVGTDLFVPYDAVDPALLPADRGTELLIYCRTGRMSAIAAKTMLALGYTSVIELDGGMVAWQSSGRSLVVAESTG